jgi:hypothetical protein
MNQESDSPVKIKQDISRVKFFIRKRFCHSRLKSMNLLETIDTYDLSASIQAVCTNEAQGRKE